MNIAYILSEEEHELLKQDIIKGWLLKKLIDYNIKNDIPVCYGTPRKKGARMILKVKNKNYIKYRDNKYIKYPDIEDINTFRIKRYKKYVDFIRNMPINDYLIRLYIKRGDNNG